MIKNVFPMPTARKYKRTLRILNRRLYAPKNTEDKEITFFNVLLSFAEVLQKKNSKINKLIKIKNTRRLN